MIVCLYTTRSTQSSQPRSTCSAVLLRNSCHAAATVMSTACVCGREYTNASVKRACGRPGPRLAVSRAESESESDLERVVAKLRGCLLMYGLTL